MPSKITSGLLGRKWETRTAKSAPPTAGLAEFLPAEVAQAVAKVLANRGVTKEELPSFYAPKIADSLPEPFLLPNAERAVGRLAKAIVEKQKVGIIGDWDVDGSCAAALLVKFFTACGLRPLSVVPDRVKDGFGLSIGPVEKMAKERVELLLAVDCGTTAHAAISRCYELGMEVIVADHHLADKQTPQSHFLVNPQLGDNEQLKGLCAAAVVFLLLVGLNRHLRREGFYKNGKEPDLYPMLELVALATVCDVMPITPLNRALIKCGLRELGKWRHPGLRALAATAGIPVSPPPNERTVGFYLGPRLNAGARMGECSLAAQLLVQPAERVGATAEQLEALNRKRRELEAEAVEQAEIQAENQLKNHSLVVSGEWLPGLAGRVAAKLAEKWLKPTFAFAKLADGLALGSARGMGSDVGTIAAEALAANLALRAGGHKNAAGITIRVSQLGALTTFIHERVKSSPPPPLLLDGEIEPEILMSREMVGALNQLAPYGEGFEPPLFALGGMSITGHKRISDQMSVLRLSRSGQKQTISAVIRGRALANALESVADEATSFTVAGRTERSPYGDQLAVVDMEAEH